MKSSYKSSRTSVIDSKRAASTATDPTTTPKKPSPPLPPPPSLSEHPLSPSKPARNPSRAHPTPSSRFSPPHIYPRTCVSPPPAPPNPPRSDNGARANTPAASRLLRSPWTLVERRRAKTPTSVPSPSSPTASEAGPQVLPPGATAPTLPDPRCCQRWGGEGGLPYWNSPTVSCARTSVGSYPHRVRRLVTRDAVLHGLRGRVKELGGQ